MIGGGAENLGKSLPDKFLLVMVLFTLNKLVLKIAKVLYNIRMFTQ